MTKFHEHTHFWTIKMDEELLTSRRAGQTIQMIAHKLGKTPNSVRNRLQRIMSIHERRECLEKCQELYNETRGGMRPPSARPKPAKPKLRTCLGLYCKGRVQFLSTDPAHRMCNKCRAAAHGVYEGVV